MHNISSTLTTQSTIQDLLNCPAFAGYADKLLPWDNQLPNPHMRLANIGELMPYHNYIQPQQIVNSLNQMQASVAQGQQIFYSFYSEQERRQDPNKNHTGLFLFRGQANAPFAIIAPGGGFAYVGALHEGFPIAQSIAQRGYNAFVIKYRSAMGGRIATEDMAKAIEFIENHAESLQVSAQNYSCWGASAGARMSAAIAAYGTQTFGTKNNSRPIANIMLYTGYSMYSHNEPATFATIGEKDSIASVEVMRKRIAQLAKLGCATEFYVFPNLEHGFALGTNTTAQGWEQKAIDFWQKQI